MKVNKIAGKKSTSPLAVQKRLQVRSTASTSGYLNFLLFHKILKKVKNKNILLFLTLLYDRALKLQITARYSGTVSTLTWVGTFLTISPLLNAPR